jgi:hypothetical protein
MIIFIQSLFNLFLRFLLGIYLFEEYETINRVTLLFIFYVLKLLLPKFDYDCFKFSIFFEKKTKNFRQSD